MQQSLYISNKGLEVGLAKKIGPDGYVVEEMDEDYDINQRYLNYKKKMEMFQNAEDEKKGLNFVPLDTKLNFNKFHGSTDQSKMAQLELMKKTYSQKHPFLKEHEAIM
jgi:hypothetical protein